MRSTRATAAVDRLKIRSGNRHYSLVRTADGLFYLAQTAGGGAPATRISDSLDLDEFVKFVNAFGPQTPRKISKLDAAFEKQLVKKIGDEK